jgi:hypothetical protein
MDMERLRKMKDPGAMAVAAGAKSKGKADAFDRGKYPTPSPPASGMSAAVHDRAILIRQFIHECMGLALDHAELARTSAEIGDDAALEYALRKFVVVARHAAGAFNDLRQIAAAGPAHPMPEAAE